MMHGRAAILIRLFIYHPKLSDCRFVQKALNPKQQIVFLYISNERA